MGSGGRICDFGYRLTLGPPRGAVEAVRIIDLGTRIAPFEEGVGDLMLCARTVQAQREQEVQFSGVAAARLTFADYAFASAPVLAAFAAACPGDRPARLALPATEALASIVTVSSVQREGDTLLFDIFADAHQDADLATLRSTAAVVLAKIDPAVQWRALPRFCPPPYRMPIIADGNFAIHLQHWVHLLWSAPLLVPHLVDREQGRRTRARGTTAKNLISPTADVHPSAYLEGAVIGDGAEIGAQCVIRHSYVGPGSRLSDFTKVAHSVLGAETHTLADANFEYMVSGGGGTLTNLLLQDSLLGRKVFLTTGVIFWRDALGEEISVDHQGYETPTGRRILGGCAGHGCVLGARTIVAPGRALPNRTTVVMRKEEGVLRIDPRVASGVPSCWYDGALVPTTDVDPNYVPEETTHDSK